MENLDIVAVSPDDICVTTIEHTSLEGQRSMLGYQSPSNVNPRARRDELLVERAGADLVIHDRENGAFHTLNDIAASVWLACDGAAKPGEIAAQIERPVDIVEVAIGQLREAGLLAAEPASGRIDRRRIVKIAAAGMALPMVTSMTLPDMTAAASFKGGDGGEGAFVCFSDSDCPGYHVGQSCTIISCEFGTCISSFAPVGTPCGGLSQSCNGEGLCLL